MSNEYISHPWSALVRNSDQKLFYLTKEKTYLRNIDARGFAGDWGEYFIEANVLYALNNYRIYYLKNKKWTDIYSEKEHAIILKKGTQISFENIEYTYLPKAKFQIKDLSNTYWDSNFLQHLLHQFKYKTKIENGKIHFWSITPHKRKIEEFRKLCFDTKKTYKTGHFSIAQNEQLPLFCQDYYQSIIPSKISMLPTVLISILVELSQHKISTYGTVVICNKFSEFLMETDRIVLHHSSKRNFELSKNILKQNKILIQNADRKLKIQFAMSLPGNYYYFRMGGKQLRQIALKNGKIAEYFDGPNFAIIKREEQKKLISLNF